MCEELKLTSSCIDQNIITMIQPFYKLKVSYLLHFSACLLKAKQLIFSVSVTKYVFHVQYLQAQNQHHQDHAMAMHLQNQELAAASMPPPQPHPAVIQSVPSEPGIIQLFTLFNLNYIYLFYRFCQAAFCI